MFNTPTGLQSRVDHFHVTSTAGSNNLTCFSGFPGLKPGVTPVNKTGRGRETGKLVEVAELAPRKNSSFLILDNNNSFTTVHMANHSRVCRPHITWASISLTCFYQKPEHSRLLYQKTISNRTKTSGEDTE